MPENEDLIEEYTFENFLEQENRIEENRIEDNTFALDENDMSHENLQDLKKMQTHSTTIDEPSKTFLSVRQQWILGISMLALFLWFVSSSLNIEFDTQQEVLVDEVSQVPIQPNQPDQKIAQNISNDITNTKKIDEHSILDQTNPLKNVATKTELENNTQQDELLKESNSQNIELQKDLKTKENITKKDNIQAKTIHEESSKDNFVEEEIVEEEIVEEEIVEEEIVEEEIVEEEIVEEEIVEEEKDDIKIEVTSEVLLLQHLDRVMNATSYDDTRDSFDIIQQNMNQLSKPRYQEVLLLITYKKAVLLTNHFQLHTSSTDSFELFILWKEVEQLALRHNQTEILQTARNNQTVLRQFLQ